MQAHGPLEVVKLGDGTTKRPAYISAKINPHRKAEVIKVLKELRGFFAWDYDEMIGLSPELIKLKSPIWLNKKTVK